MGVTTAQYVRNPLIVDAVQVTRENFAEILDWCQGTIGWADGRIIADGEDVPIDPDKQHIRIRVHNPQSPRQTRAMLRDWILYTEKGYKIYTETAFNANFRPYTAE